jgi:hypothetical protein
MPKDPFFANQPVPEPEENQTQDLPEEQKEEKQLAEPMITEVTEAVEDPVVQNIPEEAREEKPEPTTQITETVEAKQEEPTTTEKEALETTAKEAEDLLEEKLSTVKKVTPTVKKIATPKNRTKQRA